MDQDKNIQELNQKLDKLNRLIEKQISPWLTFGRGLLAALGGTVGLAILITLGVYILNKLQFLPGIGNLLQNLKFLIQRHP